jgi:hypothetical protein
MTTSYDDPDAPIAWRRFFELSHDLVCVAGFDGRFRDVNPAWERTLGFRREELTAVPFLDFVHPDDREATIRETQCLAEGGETLSFENRYRDRDGGYRWLRWNAVSDPEEGLIYASARDVTAEREAMDRLAARRAELEARVGEQTRELERRNEELQEFVYVASHDLQEPLRKIRAFGDRLAARYAVALEEQGLDYLRRMQSAARRMSELIDNLLVLSRVTTTARPSEIADLGVVAREAVADLRLRVEETGAEIEIGDLPRARVDRVQIRQLFQNLVANALKYHRSGQPPRVRVYEVDGEGEEGSGSDWIEVAVSDDGIGFEEKYLDRIFRPFQRLHGRSEYPGTGMGLAICRRIVERHQGTLTASSRPGEGATFRVCLPAAGTEDDR